MTSTNKFNCSKVGSSAAGKRTRNELSTTTGTTHSGSSSSQGETDEEEREIEVLLQKTNFPFSRHSKSAHANLSQISSKIGKNSQHVVNEEEDSDEEFFVHQALLPLRKSKTSEFVAAASALASNKKVNSEVETLAEMHKSFNLYHPSPRNNNNIAQPSLQLDLDNQNGPKASTNLECSSPPSSCSSSGSSSGGAVPGCWSAPPAFSVHHSCSSSASLSRSDLSDDLVENECDDSELFLLDEELKGKNDLGILSPEKDEQHDGFGQIKRSGSSWSSPSRLCAKGKAKSEGINEHGNIEQIVKQDLDMLGEQVVLREAPGVEHKEGAAQEVGMCTELEETEEKMSTSSEDAASEEEDMLLLLSRSGSPLNGAGMGYTTEETRGIPKSSSFKSSSRRIFIAPEYSGPSQVPVQNYTNSSKFPSSKSDPQLIWYHTPVSKKLSRPRTPKFDESLNSLGEEEAEHPQIDYRQPLPHSATYCLGSGSAAPRYSREWSFQARNGDLGVRNSDIAAKNHQRLSMPLPFADLKGGLSEQEEEELYCSDREEVCEQTEAGYSMAPHKWEIKWRKHIDEKRTRKGSQPCTSSINSYQQQHQWVGQGASMKKKRSSFTLDEVVGASIPMADDLTALSISGTQECAQVYCHSSSSCSSSPPSSEYDNNYYSDGAAQQAGYKADKLGKTGYIGRRSPPLACADDMLSDSEISELEKKVARGDFSATAPSKNDQVDVEKDVLTRTLGTQIDSQPTDSKATGNTAVGQQPVANSSKISGSSSMPCFSSTAIQTEHQPQQQFQNSWFDCQEETEKAIGNETKQHHPPPLVMMRSATMITQTLNGCRQKIQFDPQWSALPQQRRMLPLRPDEVLRQNQQIATSQPQQLAIEQQTRSKPSRRLPQIPPQPFSVGPEVDSLAEYPIAANNGQKISLVKSGASLSLLQRPRTMTTLQEDLGIGQKGEQHQKAEIAAETPMLVSSSTLAKLLPQPVYRQAERADKTEYQLSYGVESLVSSFTTTAAEHTPCQHATNKYGIMEDSYYEDGLNGNNAAEDRDVMLNANRHLNEDNRKNSGYNLAEENSSGISSCCTSSSTNADHPTNRGVAGIAGPSTASSKHSRGPTHRVQFPFSPRHTEEIALEVGDAVKVERECEDHWCYGTNMRTSQHGIFPTAHVCEIDLVEEICQGILQANVQLPLKQDRDTFYLTMLASVEVGHHKGNDVLVQAINKICSVYQQKDEILIPQTVLMEVSFRGIHVIDKRRKDFFRCPTFDFFFSLQNISFCGAHPKQLRYFGFITKHPLLPRFACHVFLSQESTQPIVEAIGRAFKRSYDEYMAFAHPTEDIFIE